MTERRQEEVDRVPVFWGAAPEPLAAHLSFRVGSSDESLVGHGVTHLIEHLALSGIRRQRYYYNGTVDQTTASFFVNGTDAEVASFLNSVALALAELPLDRLATERGILRAEEAQRANSPLGLLLGLRYGTRAHGLLNYPEFALRGIEPGSVDDWRTRYFTADNAVLSLTGPPPAGLDLSPLPSGTWRPPVSPSPLDQALPAWFPCRANVVAVSMMAPRSAGLRLAVEAITHRLRARLRDAEGLSYDVSCSYEQLDLVTAHVAVVADTLAERADDTRDAFQDELDRFCDSGPIEAELRELHDDRRHQEVESPYGPALLAFHRSRVVLLHGKDELDEMNARLEAASIGDLQDALRDALDSAIWLVPAQVGMADQRVVPIEDQSPSAVDGEEFWPAPNTGPHEEGERLVIGTEGLTRWADLDRPITIRHADCQAVEVWDDDARTFWGHDGLWVFVHPSAWRDGQRAVAALDAHLDPQLRVCMGRASGYTPPEADVTADDASNAPRTRRHILPWRR